MASLISASLACNSVWLIGMTSRITCFSSSTHNSIFAGPLPLFQFPLHFHLSTAPSSLSLPPPPSPYQPFLLPQRQTPYHHTNTAPRHRCARPNRPNLHPPQFLTSNIRQRICTEDSCLHTNLANPRDQHSTSSKWCKSRWLTSSSNETSRATVSRDI